MYVYTYVTKMSCYCPELTTTDLLSIFYASTHLHTVFFCMYACVCVCV